VQTAIIPVCFACIGLGQTASGQVSVSVSLPPPQVRAFQNNVEKGKGDAPEHAVTKPKSNRKQMAQTVTKFDREKHDYSGFLREAAISVNMSIYGKVEGDLYFLRAPDRLYTISGRNAREGVIELTLLDDGVAVGKAEMRRDPSLKSVIHWIGTMHDNEGKSYRFFLSRLVKPDAPIATPPDVASFESLKAPGMERYEGTVTNAAGMIAKSVFKLRITDTKCYGFYYQKYPNETTSRILGLHGDNTPAELFLRESDNDGISAEFHLKKRLMPDVIIWQGTLQNIRDNNDTKEVVFSRLRTL
jgi:hypothetical protein